MQRQNISEAEFHMLRMTQWWQIKPGDLMYGPRCKRGQVVATPGPDGAVAVRADDGNILMWHYTNLRLAPLLWLEDKPVYPGDKLYWADHTTFGSLEVSNTCPDFVIGNTPRGGIRIREGFLSWNEVRWLDDQLLRIGDTVYKKGDATPLTVHNFTEDCVYTGPNDGIRLKTLTREKPEVETLVEGQPVVEGETLYHKSIDVQGVVVRWCNNTVGLDTGQGVIGFSAQVLTRTDPTILFYVEGKPVRKGDTVWTLSGDEVIVKRMEHGKVITSPSDWCCCTVFDKEWLSLTPIKRIVVDGETVDQSDLLYFRESGEEFKVFRQVLDVLEDCKGRKAHAHQLTYSDPKQELAEVPILVNFHDDGTSTVMFNAPGVTRCVKYQANGIIKVPKHIADKMKR